MGICYFTFCFKNFCNTRAIGIIIEITHNNDFGMGIFQTPLHAFANSRPLLLQGNFFPLHPLRLGQ